MRREDRFVFSHRPYAVDLSSFHVVTNGTSLLWSVGMVEAVWFRRRAEVTVACVGLLRNNQKPTPVNAREFLEHYEDGRYGGDCRSRWDGESFWSASQDPDVHMADLAQLRRLLTAYETDPKNPALDTRHDGWWVF